MKRKREKLLTNSFLCTLKVINGGKVSERINVRSVQGGVNGWRSFDEKPKVSKGKLKQVTNVLTNSFPQLLKDWRSSLGPL